MTDADLARVDGRSSLLDHRGVVINLRFTQAEVGEVQGRTVADDEAGIGDTSADFQTTARPARDGDEVILIRARPVR